MAYVNQYAVDQANDKRISGLLNQAASGVAENFQGFVEDRRRALEGKRSLASQGLELAKEGATDQEIKEFQATGTSKGLMDKYAAKAEAARLRAQNDAELDREYKRSQITKNNRDPLANKMSDQDKINYKLNREKESRGSIAEQGVDRKFSDDYNDFIVNGGYTKVDRGLKTLKEVSSSLGAKNGPNLTGGLLGRTPDFINGIFNPDAIEARDKVGAIIQDNLKTILGASYTEKEGERVIERAYNPKLSEEANKAKLDELIMQMESGARAKLEASKYYEQNGTMRGFKGTLINNVDDIFNIRKPTQKAIQPQIKPEHVNQVKQMTDEQLLQFVNGGN